jgi:conjugal transfer pilus assembly protein TraB
MSDAIRPASTIEKITRYKVWGIIIVLLGVTLFFGRQIADNRRADITVEEAPTINLTPGSDQLKRVKLEKDILLEQQKRAQMEKLISDQQEQLGSLNSKLDDMAKANIKMMEDFKTKLSTSAMVAPSDVKMPPKPTNSNLPQPPSLDAPYNIAGNNGSPHQGVVMRTPVTNNTASAATSPINSGSHNAGAIIIKPTTKSQWAQEQETVKNTKVTWKENKYAGYLVDGAFAEVNTLHGLDAGTSDYTRTNPQPIFFRVNKDAILPGGSKYSMKECFVFGVGYGDLSSERVYIQSSKLSCVRKSDKKLLTSPLDGYVVDSDGVLGMRGRVISRKGALLYKSLLAGFAEGAAQILAASNTTQIVAPATGTITSAIDLDKAMETGLYNGVGVAAKRLADVYIKEAEQIFPVINLPPGRKATFVVKQGVQLKWESYDDEYIASASPPTSGTVTTAANIKPVTQLGNGGLALPQAPVMNKN